MTRPPLTSSPRIRPFHRGSPAGRQYRVCDVAHQAANQSAANRCFDPRGRWVRSMLSSHRCGGNVVEHNAALGSASHSSACGALNETLAAAGCFCCGRPLRGFPDRTTPYCLRIPSRAKSGFPAFIPAGKPLMVFPADGWHFSTISTLALRRGPDASPPPAAAADYHHIIAFGATSLPPLFRRQRFTDFSIVGDRFHRLAHCGPGNGIDVRYWR